MINTLNESHLHKTVKNLIALETEGHTEVKINNYYIDVLSGKNVYEIQTQNVSSLKEKITNLLESGYKVTIVHPFAKNKTIKTITPEKQQQTLRKSPKHKSIYSCFKEITGLTDLIKANKISITLIECSIIEERIATSEKVQSENKRRRFKKNWNKSNKLLEEIEKRWEFTSLKDYKNTLPYKKGQEFSIKELKDKLKENGFTVEEKDLRIYIWVLIKLNIIEKTDTRKNRCIIYKTK